MSNPMKVPFVDLVAPHVDMEEDLVAVFRSVLRSAGFVGGPMVTDFENEFARFCDSSHCAAISTGTDALRFALMAAGVAPGDIVLTVPHTFIATTEAITQAGAVIGFVDIDENSYTMDPAKLREYIEGECEWDGKAGKLKHRKSGRPVTAVVPVHLYGQTADMDPILDLARRHKLMVIEDACQAHGAQYFSRAENRWKKAGSMGQAAAFSFYPGKNLGACGEGGAVTTNNEELAKKVRVLRDHGQAQKYYHDIEGYNGRLHSLQAGLLKTKLPHLAGWNAKRRELAHRYHEQLASGGDGIGVPREASWTKGVYHLYVVRVKDREALQAHLTEMGIGTGIHYPIPLHLQKAYRHLGCKRGDFPVTEKVASQILSLPMYPQMSEAQQRIVSEAVLGFLMRARNGAHRDVMQPLATT